MPQEQGLCRPGVSALQLAPARAWGKEGGGGRMRGAGAPGSRAPGSLWCRSSQWGRRSRRRGRPCSWPRHTGGSCRPGRRTGPTRSGGRAGARGRWRRRRGSCCRRGCTASTCRAAHALAPSAPIPRIALGAPGWGHRGQALAAGCRGAHHWFWRVQTEPAGGWECGATHEASSPHACQLPHPSNHHIQPQRAPCPCMLEARTQRRCLRATRAT